MSNWLLLSFAAITFLNRYAFFAESLRYSPGTRTRRFLQYSSYAVLTAIWTPLVFEIDKGNLSWVTGWDYFLAATLAAVLTLMRVRSMAVVLLSIGAFFALRFLS